MTGNRLALVRHGETDWNLERRLQGRTDIPLNGTGRQQALDTARQLAESEWSYVISSPLSRAVETASLIASATGAQLLDPVSGLTERSYGTAEGFGVADALLAWPSEHYPESESAEDAAARGTECLTAICEQHPGNLIVVSHGALIRGSVTRLTGEPTPRILNGEITYLERVGDAWSAYKSATNPR